MTGVGRQDPLLTWKMAVGMSCFKFVTAVLNHRMESIALYFLTLKYPTQSHSSSARSDMNLFVYLIIPNPEDGPGPRHLKRGLRTPLQPQTQFLPCLGLRF